MPDIASGILDRTDKLQFRNVVALAPMVRVGTLPMRVLALQYGADVVYSEEIIERNLMNAKRVENEAAGTVDFYSSKNQYAVFRTAREEAGRVVVQLGSADPVMALDASLTVARDVAGIDLNMGCPLPYSTKGGMGSALLSKPEVVYDILSTLRRNLPSHVTVTGKIRLLEDVHKTIELCRRIEASGVDALAVHARYVVDRPRDRARWELLRAARESVKIPFLANGDVNSLDDALKLRELCGADGVMIARAAQNNPSIFRKEGMLSPWDVSEAYAALCIKYDNWLGNTKFCLQSLLSAGKHKAAVQMVSKARDYSDIRTVFPRLAA
mmetsp:Transcript_2800/g.8517  ORF Transcript_2800/g.8517 Transcript_2800/m.8517 type:complete len:326 (-) Transcript_2800:1840-2817(-)